MFATVLNFTALATGVVIAALGVWLLARRLPRPAAGVVCGNCGASAAALPDFTCRGCGEDVRLTGIVTPGRSRLGRRGRARFFVCVWTALILMLAMALAHGVENARAGGYLRRADVEQWWAGPAGMRRLRFAAVGRVTTGKEWAVERAAVEIFAADGRMAELEVRGPWPSSVTARDPSGRQVFADRPLEPARLHEWLAASYPDLGGDQLTDLSRALHGALAVQIRRERAFPLPGEPGRTFPSGPATSRSRTDDTRAPPPLFLPAAVIGWPLLWLAGLVWLLPREPFRGATAPGRDSSA